MFSWTIETKQDKGLLWYTIAGIISLSLVIWGFVEWIYALSIVVIILVWVYVLVENNAPASSVIRINEDGILAGDEFYEYQRIEYFGIVYNNGTPILLRLLLKTKGLRTLDIDLSPAVSASEIRAFLSGYIEENEKSELSFTESLLRMAKL